jgi:hypothetical protein
VLIRASAFALSLLLLEAICRVAAIVPRPLNTWGVASDVAWRYRWARQEPPRGLRYLAYDPSRGWATIKNLRGGFPPVGASGPAPVSTDSWGLRGRAERAPGCRHGRKRVLVLGDSFTFGEEVGDGETYPARLERLLPGVELLNAGVGGYGHDQMLLLMREALPRYCPDLVLLSYLESDSVRNQLAFRDFAKPRFEVRGGQAQLTGVPVPSPEEMLRRHHRGSRLLDFGRLAYERLFPRPDATPFILEQLAKEAASAKTPLALFMAAETDPAIHWSSSDAWFRGFCAARSLDCMVLDPGPKAPGYGHWSPAQHAEVARRLAPFVAAALRRRPR